METNTQKEIKNQVVSKTTNENPSKIVPIWKSQLDRYETGKIKNSLNNFKMILENDERFKGKIRLNEFTLRTMIKTKNGYKNIDDNIITNMLFLIEKDYDGINKRDLIEKVIDTVGEDNKFHPIRDYLDGLQWDGQKRLKSAFADYFGCEASEYNEYCLRTFLNGAIARVLHPRY
jgi:predicted P-loop ATPase